MELRLEGGPACLARTEEVLVARGRVLEAIALGRSLPEVLEVLADSTEQVIPGVRCSVLLRDAARGVLTHGASPSFPEVARLAMDGIPIAEGQGACGTCAHRASRVVVGDVRDDPLTAPWRELLVGLGVHALWSEPILGVDGVVLGTFALYYDEVRTPGAEEIEFMRTSAHLARIAIERTHDLHRSQQNQERMQELLGNLREVVWLTDWDQNELLYVSPSYEAIWNRSCQSLFERPGSWAESIHPEDRDRVYEAFTRHAPEGSYEAEYRILLPGGGIRWIYDRAFPIREADGSVHRVAGISEDITARKAIEHALLRSREELEARVLERTRVLKEITERLAAEVAERERAQALLRDSEERFRELAENIDEVFWLSAADSTQVLYVSPAYARVWGRPVEGLYQNPRDWQDAIHPEDFGRVRQAFEERVRAGGYDVEYRVVRPDGGIRWIHDRGFVVKERGDSPVRVAGLALDITARKDAESQLARQRERLRALASDLILTEERERRRLAVDLHDSLCQNLALALMRLAGLEERVPRRFLPELEGIGGLLRGVDSAARSLTFQLSPPVLHDFGLEAGVQWLAEEMDRVHGLQVEVSAPEESIPMDPRVRIFLYRAARELLINVVKHARTSKAWISIAQEDGELELEVRDEGCSFELGPEKELGFGLFSVQERVEELGGSMWLDARPARGTRIKLRSPLQVVQRQLDERRR